MSRIRIKSTIVAVLVALTGLGVTAAPAGAAPSHAILAPSHAILAPSHAILRAILN